MNIGTDVASEYPSSRSHRLHLTPTSHQSAHFHGPSASNEDEAEARRCSHLCARLLCRDRKQCVHIFEPPIARPNEYSYSSLLFETQRDHVDVHCLHD